MRVIWGDRSSDRTVMPAAGAMPPDALEDANQREWMATRWQFEDERYERQALHAEFAALLDRVGDSSSPVLRIYGVERLTDAARRRVPGGTALVNPDGFPFFIPAARVLTALLTLETQPEVRRAARLTLNDLIDFARQGEQALLYALIPALADCNRACLRTLCETLGRYLAKYGGEETTLPPLAPLLRLTGNTEATLCCLESLVESEECRTAREQFGALRVAQAKFGEPSSAPNNHLLETLCADGARLMESRDLLGSALGELHAPPLGIDSSEVEFGRWRAARPLALEDVFLAGAKLSGIAIPGATLVESHLEGANLEGANLTACEMRGAHMSGAELYGALLEGDPLPLADLREADWWDASEASWRGSGGEAQRRWLQQNYPEPATPLSMDETPTEPTPTDVLNALRPTTLPSPGLVTPPVDTPEPGGGQSAAQKIAELKRKAQGKDPAKATPEPPTLPRPVRTDGARTDPRRRDNPVPATVKDSGRGALPFTPGKVVLRDKALPNDTDILSESDLMEVTDLMTEETPPEKPNANGRQGDDDGLTDEDLLAIEDLMKKPGGK